MSKREIVIVTLHQRWGGAIVQHKLCSLLEEKGYNAKIFYADSVPRNDKPIRSWTKWFLVSVKNDLKMLIAKVFPNAKFTQTRRFDGYTYLPVKGCKRKWLPLVSKEAIVIYPEIVYGNFLRAKNVVRWLLFQYPYKNEKMAFDKSDVFFCYREVFNDVELNPECKKLFVHNFDFALYKQTNFDEREGCCYIIRKGRNRKDIPEKFDGVVIDGLSEKEKVRVFNKCKYCYSYDTQTFYTSIAAICGCIPIVVVEPGCKKEDYIGTDDESLGIAFGDSDEEIEYAISTRKKLLEKVNSWNEANSYYVEKFISECEKIFNIEF